jgi:osmotically inducible protein OsmC
MSISTAQARWTGDIKNGKGKMRSESGTLGQFSASTRFAGKKGTNPEELIGAAQAGCFAMALSAKLTEAGHPPRTVDASAEVQLDRIGDEYVISRVDVHAEAAVDGLGEERFQEIVREAGKHCPIAQALRVPVALQASLAPAK